MEELVPCEPRALIVRPRFCVIDSLEKVTSMKAPYNTQSGTVAGSC